VRALRELCVVQPRRQLDSARDTGGERRRDEHDADLRGDRRTTADCAGEEAAQPIERGDGQHAQSAAAHTKAAPAARA